MEMIDSTAFCSDQSFRTEFCVIGSGAGGAVAAWELARSGHRVLLVEEGGSFQPQDFLANGMEAIAQLYRDAGMVATMTLPFIQIPLGRCVGGTTVINCGTSFRLRPDYYAHLADLVSSEELAPYFSEIETLLHIAPADAARVGKQNLLLQQGAEKLGYHGGFIPRNAWHCQGAGNCNLGCPSGAKLSMEASFVPWALQQGAQCLYHTRAIRLRPRRDSVTISCTTIQDPSRRVTIEADKVLLAAGTLQTPLLLRRSRLKRLSAQVGRNLSIHPTSGVTGRFAEPVEMWHGIPQGYFVDELATEGILFEGVATTPDLAALAIPLKGPAHTEFMHHFAQMASIGLMVSDEPVGSVRAGLGGMSWISYAISDQVLLRMRRAYFEGARLLFAAGAERVYFNALRPAPVSSLAELERFDLQTVSSLDIHWGAFHPLGTCRMSPTAEQGVVDRRGRVFGQDNIYICDGSIFPASTQINPQLPIMAMALRIARLLHRPGS